MGIFQKIFGQSKQESDEFNNETKDEREAKCPYCCEKLEKVPGRKTKCQYCDEFMFVRTRPKDKARVVVTKKQADEIDRKWMIINGTYDEYLAEKEELEKERDILKKRFGKEPSEHDIRWGVFNKRLIKCAQNGDWGLYRNARFEMAELLRKETKLKHALQTYLEVCYLDLNGPNNIGGMNDPELLKEFPMFDPKNSAFLAPAVVNHVRIITKKLGMENIKIGQLFIEHNKKIGQSLNLPLVPEECWNKIEKELYEKNLNKNN